MMCSELDEDETDFMEILGMLLMEVWPEGGGVVGEMSAMHKIGDSDTVMLATSCGRTERGKRLSSET